MAFFISIIGGIVVTVISTYIIRAIDKKTQK